MFSINLLSFDSGLLFESKKQFYGITLGCGNL